ncbi:endochitinase class V precursor [Cordyceps militaris]|uniref:Endochitinase class V n=1 Tax=Cordyceps militaris TaxID=73501 RepID=A0A2H4SFE1_CORMI|nr:endochitinase class V precursor [Cordyceps militaris]
MVHAAIILALFALAVHGAPGKVRTVPPAAETTVAAPSPTNTLPASVSSVRRAALGHAGRDDKTAIRAQEGGANSTDAAAVVPSALTTMSRPSKVTSAAVRTASSNKLSPTGTSTTVLATTVTMSSKGPSYTPASVRHAQDRKTVVDLTNWSVSRFLQPNGAKLTSSPSSACSGKRIREEHTAGRRCDHRARGNSSRERENRNIGALGSRDRVVSSATANSTLAVGAVDGRRRFASYAVKLVANWEFPSVDIRWDYPKQQPKAAHLISLF